MTSTLSDDVIDLLSNHVDCFEKLDMVLALHEAPSSSLSFDELATKLGITREAAREAALGLRASSIVEITTQGDVHLLPLTGRERKAVDELVVLYRADRFRIVRVMGEIAVRRIRNMATRAFADAFVIRKRRKDEDG